MRIKKNKVVATSFIGNIRKRGDKLNLKETHALICKKNHETITTHDPKHDVLMTVCIYDKLNYK